MKDQQQKDTERFYFIASIAGAGAAGEGMSGGDRIAIEIAKRWSQMGIQVRVATGQSGLLMYKRYLSIGSRNSPKVMRLTPLIFGRFSVAGAVLYGFLTTIKAIIFVLTECKKSDSLILYSASDMLPDSLPAFLARRFYPRCKWIAGFFLFHPNPFSDTSPYRGLRRFRNIVLYVMQFFSYRMISKEANMVWVTNELDRWRFIDNKRLTPDKVIAVRGGVDAKTPLSIPKPGTYKFHAVFIGRFHPQKGVLESIDIWRYVCKKKTNAKLALIGVGELESQVSSKIKEYGLQNNVAVLGFKDGTEKLKIFKESRIVIHPAIYDSGGMAACEAMACGLPGVSFDLPALQAYYPNGMLKTPCFDLEQFAENILLLLHDEQLHAKLSKEALGLAMQWDWDKRAQELLSVSTSIRR